MDEERESTCPDQVLPIKDEPTSGFFGLCTEVETDGSLTLSQTTNFKLFQIESLQTTILNLMKIAESSLNR